MHLDIEKQDINSFEQNYRRNLDISRKEKEPKIFYAMKATTPNCSTFKNYLLYRLFIITLYPTDAILANIE